MNDSDAIRNLIASYAQGVDDGRAADVAALFAIDGELETMGVTISGREAIGRMLAGLPRSPTKHTQCNTVVNIAGSSASATTDLVLLAPDTMGVWAITGCARYTDSLVRNEYGWLLKHRLFKWHDQTPAPLIDAMRASIEATEPRTE